MTTQFHAGDAMQVDANANGTFTFGIGAPMGGSGIETLTQAQTLELCGWIIGQAALRAIGASGAAEPIPVDQVKRRAGYWTLKSHAISMPPHLRTPDAVRTELYALGIRFLEGHVTRDCITFKGCTMVPERLPGWLTAEQREDRADG